MWPARPRRFANGATMSASSHRRTGRRSSQPDDGPYGGSAATVTRLDGLVALGPAISVSPGRSVGVPVGVRANLRLVLARGELRRRPRPRAGHPEHLLSRAEGRRRHCRRELPCSRPTRLPAGKEPASATPRANRCPHGNERGRRQGCRRALSRRVQRASRGHRRLRSSVKRRRASGSCSSGTPTSVRTPGLQFAHFACSTDGNSSSCAAGRSWGGRMCREVSAAGCISSPRSTRPPGRRYCAVRPGSFRRSADPLACSSRRRCAVWRQWRPPNVTGSQS